MGITTNRRSMKYVPLSPSVKRDMAFGLAFASLLVTLAACGGSLVEPSGGEKAPMDGEPAGGPPAISPAGNPIYVRVSPSYVPGARERYVFYDDSSFGLQYAPPDWDWDSSYEFPGSYTREESVISFRWRDGAWTATGTVRGDTLTVKYS